MLLTNRNLTVFGAMTFLAIGAHQYALRRSGPPSSDRDAAASATAAPSPSGGRAAADEPVAAPPGTEPDEEALWADAWRDPPAPDPFALQRVRDEMAEQMREYARTADPDCPHAMSEEAIDAFRQHGDPVIF